MPELQSFLTLEASLRRPLRAAFEREVGPQAQEIVDLVLAGQADAAIAAAGRLCFGACVDGMRGRFETHALQSLLLGASFLRGKVRGTNLFRSGVLPVETIKLAADQIESVLLAGDAYLQRQVRGAIADAAAQPEPEAHPLGVAPDDVHDSPEARAFTVVRKAVDLALAEKLLATTMGTGKALVDIGAALVTSRLVQLGFLDEAHGAGVTWYQITAVLDEHTCRVCMGFHGRTFKVEDARRRLLDQLRMTGDELKATAPFPKADRAGLETLAGLDDEQLAARGWSTPPYHPSCRCILVPVGTVPFSERGKFVAPPPKPPKPVVAPQAQPVVEPVAQPAAAQSLAIPFENRWQDKADASLEFRARMSGAWDAMPESARRALIDNGTVVVPMRRARLDFAPGVHGGGEQEVKRLNEAGAYYSWNDRVVVLMEKSGNPNLARNLEYVMSHEVGHALDDALGAVSRSDQEFLDAYKADWQAILDAMRAAGASREAEADAQLLGYYAQRRGSQGAAEAFAESYAHIVAPDKAKRYLDDTSDAFLRRMTRTIDVVRKRTMSASNRSKRARRGKTAGDTQVLVVPTERTADGGIRCYGGGSSGGVSFDVGSRVIYPGEELLGTTYEQLDARLRAHSQGAS